MTSTPPSDPTSSSLTDPNNYRRSDIQHMAAAELPPPPAMSAAAALPVHEPELASSNDTTRRKRLSFFGRTTSDANTRKQQPLQPLQASLSTAKGEVPRSQSRQDAPLTRPMTAGSEHARRKTSDQIESIRNSIFGGRKGSISARPNVKRSRQSHPTESKTPNVALIPFASPLQEEKAEAKGNVGAQDFRSENDFYHHRKKTSISSPFNFHHVGHTDRKNLPTRLETVDEATLQNKLLDFDAEGRALQQNPTRRSVGMSKALPALPQPQVIPSRHRSSPSVDETTFDETADTKFTNLDEHFSARPAWTSPTHRPPRHSASSPNLCSPTASSAAHTTPHLHTDASDDVKSPPSEESPQPGQHAQLPTRGRPLGQSFREKQPLPPVPGPAAATAIGQKASDASLVSDRQIIGLQFPAPPGAKMNYPASVASQKSKRSSKSAAPTTQSASTRAFSDIPVGVDWEDDIDWAFEQEAEATCDFDWEKYADEKEKLPVPSPDDESPESSGSGGVRLSAWMNDPSALDSQAKHVSASSTPATSPYMDDGAPQNHKRGSSVGHRGFLAARNASSDKLTKTPPMSVEIKASESPYASQTYFPTFDSSIPEYLSDPESTRVGGARHRKSSSYGSFDSSGRSLQTASASDSTRWSSASTSSIPDLLHSYNSNRKSVRRSAASGTFRLLESVPHSPDGRDESKSFPVDAAERPTVTDRAISDGILMRRPATSGDRALLFQSGRVVQRGRSTTSSRMQIRSLPGDGQEGGWI
ncbi:hypothetical protein CERZMDRAFT_107463 [Cercospora zeae-maydis SCOH1-5]|uniref:CRIB domain-containing protein n=1 Tax=Cercospora zeae-maydis SCOH1-5 TaxID=717836 RepID=A0A6A6F635_9PEZI|nr:hypothetical protein CERZMDRAFT_107463 [Cercospora zeae-maydis SCOH1-5]